MAITFDPAKCTRTLAERGLDFADADFGLRWCHRGSSRHSKRLREERIICSGLLERRMVVLGYTPRGADHHIFSMRKANEREQARIAPLLEI